MFKPSLSSFSNLLVENWAPQFLETSPIVFRSNTKIAINNFLAFKGAYIKTITDFFNSTFPGSPEAKRKQLWITEQINLALDLFWEPLARAAEQLKSEPYREFFANNSALESMLDEFKVNVRGLFGEPASYLVDKILIYFDKTTKINRYPYTDIALIGIPYRVLTDKQDERKTWMPIAHELGHYIYWNMSSYFDLASQKETFEQGILEKQKVDHNLTDNVKNLIKPWMEEIFVDTIGTRISGISDIERQEFLASSKELILRKTDNEKSNLSLDDENHVPDGLRLLVPLVSLGVPDPIAQWKAFLEIEVGKKADDIELNLRDNNGEILSEKIKAVELADQICNTVNIILAEIEKFKQGKESLFKIQSAPSSATNVANELLEVAKKRGGKDPNEVLAIALNPEIFEGEAGGSSHSHTWKTSSPHSHSETKSHTH